MIVVTIKVIPNAALSRVILGSNGALKCYLTSAPEKGKANKELINFLAKHLKVPRGAVTLVKGLASRTKKICIDTPMSYQEFLEKLGIEVTKSLLE